MNNLYWSFFKQTIKLEQNIFSDFINPFQLAISKLNCFPVHMKTKTLNHEHCAIKPINILNFNVFKISKLQAIKLANLKNLEDHN